MKFKNNNKGFTLVELLAVIVVLAIIMVIATTQVNKAISSARTDSFVSSYKMILREVKNRMAMDGLGDTLSVSCTTTTCAESYDISSNDYILEITDHLEATSKVGYDVKLAAKAGGKFANVKPGTYSGITIVAGTAGTTTGSLTTGFPHDLPYIETTVK
ncbi:MAG: prepilin-type N-terminal cleavage/methylation domain-containing protein [Bacilli bacterium]